MICLVIVIIFSWLCLGVIGVRLMIHDWTKTFTLKVNYWHLFLWTVGCCAGVIIFTIGSLIWLGGLKTKTLFIIGETGKESMNETWDCPMKKECYGCIPAIEFKIKECTNIDIEEIERLSKIIKFLETHVQVKGEWIKK